MMLTAHKYDTRLSAKRKRLETLDDVLLPAPKAQKTTSTPQCKSSRAMDLYDALPASKVKKTIPKTRSRPSRAAERAERAERKNVEGRMKNRAPEDEIDPAELASSGTKPELRLYGWPYKRQHMLDYAIRHHIRFPIAEACRELFGGMEEFEFADLTEEHYSNSRLMTNIYCGAAFMTICKLQEVTGLQLNIGRPYSPHWDGMVYIWSNYDMEKRWRLASRLERFERGVEIIDRAMNEGGCGERSKLQWWYTYDKDVSRFASRR